MAWLALCLALGVHVADEALTDFLSVYNTAVQAIRAKIPYLPLPSFTLDVWLAGLIFGIMLLFSLTPFVFRGSRWMAPLSYVFGALMLGNGLLHIAGSIYSARLMPGVYSAPLLVGCSVSLLVCTRKHRKPVLAT